VQAPGFPPGQTTFGRSSDASEIREEKSLVDVIITRRHLQLRHKHSTTVQCPETGILQAHVCHTCSKKKDTHGNIKTRMQPQRVVVQRLGTPGYRAGRQIQGWSAHQIGAQVLLFR
jgi:hypothetical protein